LLTKDINPDKWTTKRMVNPLHPEYEIPTKSGRKVRIGPIDRNTPSSHISLKTRRAVNYIADIEGALPRRTNAISEN
jgi:hypothetical protein